ncbi:hypothetical protein SCHPADRAFT_929928 [Schizopora paradoxa]|uniref:Uncharacterized protein n=1 Tax=Schizopora paradoxa TaxID=27342 RepID=A0A0H2RI09_9AGAM|nr:hypothetical protein SCHPADRAFT_929928 [Schizopora paradoxa]
MRQRHSQPTCLEVELLSKTAFARKIEFPSNRSSPKVSGSQTELKQPRGGSFEAVRTPLSEFQGARAYWSSASPHPSVGGFLVRRFFAKFPTRWIDLAFLRARARLVIAKGWIRKDVRTKTDEVALVIGLFGDFLSPRTAGSCNPDFDLLHGVHGQIRGRDSAPRKHCPNSDTLSNQTQSLSEVKVLLAVGVRPTLSTSRSGPLVLHRRISSEFDYKQTRWICRPSLRSGPKGTNDSGEARLMWFRACASSGKQVPDRSFVEESPMRRASRPRFTLVSAARAYWDNLDIRTFGEILEKEDTLQRRVRSYARQSRHAPGPKPGPAAQAGREFIIGLGHGWRPMMRANSKLSVGNGRCSVSPVLFRIPPPASVPIPSSRVTTVLRHHDHGSKNAQRGERGGKRMMAEMAEIRVWPADLFRDGRRLGERRRLEPRLVEASAALRELEKARNSGLTRNRENWESEGAEETYKTTSKQSGANTVNHAEARDRPTDPVLVFEFIEVDAIEITTTITVVGNLSWRIVRVTDLLTSYSSLTSSPGHPPHPSLSELRTNEQLTTSSRLQVKSRSVMKSSYGLGLPGALSPNLTRLPDSFPTPSRRLRVWNCCICTSTTPKFDDGSVDNSARPATDRCRFDSIGTQSQSRRKALGYKLAGLRALVTHPGHDVSSR